MHAAMFETILDNLTDGLVIHDPTLRVVRFNQAALSILAVTEDQLMGKTPMDPQWKMIKADGRPFPHDENPAVVAIQTNRPVDAVMGLECGPDPLRWIRIRATPVDVDGHLHAIVTFTDITRDRLIQLQNELVLETSGIGIWRYNIQTRTLSWGTSMFELYGVDIDTFTVDTDAWRGRVHPADLSRVEHQLDRLIHASEALDTSFRIHTPTGVKFIRARATLTRDAADRPFLVIGTNSDITDTKLREAEMHALGEVKDRFIATMSHEVRTPLHGIIGLSELIERETSEPALQAHIRTLNRSAHHLNTLITDILDFSKMKSGMMTLAPEAFHIQTLVHDEVSLHTARLAPRCHLHTDLGSPPPVAMMGDPLRLRQVVSNLISNAVKFTEVGSILVTVDQTLTAEGARLRVAVTDTGVGIPKAKQAGLFRDFYQADRSRARQHEGSGLGLAISKRLIDLMGGTLAFRSTEGVGSSFWFEVHCPVAAEPPSDPGEAVVGPSVETPTGATHPIGRGRTLQVMEDNEVNRMIATELAERLGFDVVASCDGVEGLVHYRSHRPDLILLDLHMPRLDGAAVLDDIRSTDAHTPIIVVTAEDSAEMAQRLLASGASGIVRKPFRQGELEAAISSVLVPHPFAAGPPLDG